MAAPDSSIFFADGPWTHRTVAANGARFHVAELGPDFSRGPMVLLLHGFPEFWWAWRHQMVALAAAGYRVVAMDLRGYGASDKPPRGYDPVTLSNDVAGVIKSLGEPNATVVGHDWGGFLGWTLAVRYPALVRRLVVVSMPHPRQLRGALVGDWEQVRAGGYIAGFQRPWVPERQLMRDDAALVARLLDAWSGPGGLEPAAVERYRAAMRVPGTAHCSLEFYRWVIRSLLRPDGTRFARRMRTPVTVPTLQLHGEADRALLARVAAESVRYVAGPYQWRLLDGVGHYPHEEVPEVFTAELLNWLADPEPERAAQAMSTQR